MSKVAELPRLRRFKFERDGTERLTHHLFRFPAKFHPPVVRQLIRDYTEEGDCILDPFCGSGTLMVEASVLGRDSIGVDVDPLSVFVSKVKIQVLRERSLNIAAGELDKSLTKLQRSAAELEILAESDLDDEEYEAQLAGAWVPEIPRLTHWFYRYAIVDLAHLLEAINELEVPETQRRFLRLVFAATIRSASRADPVPVSGLEVTKLMLEKEAVGRRVDVIALFRRRLRRAIEDMGKYHTARDLKVEARAYVGDVAKLARNIAPSADAVITSPPYHGAVDYYRRHQLEMFWLGMTKNHDERLVLLERYLGRPKVPQRHLYLQDSKVELAKARTVEEKMRVLSVERANAFKHYAVGMSRAITNVARRTKTGAYFVLVVGHSSWNGDSIDTSSLMEELAGPYFELSERYWYPIKNRYMSYERRNGANIDREYVLVLRRTKAAT